MSEVQKRLVLGASSVLLVVALWEASGRLEWMNPLFTSYPTEVWREATQLFGEPRLARDIRLSLSSFGWGYLLAVVVAVPFGLAMGRYRYLRYFVEPTFMAAYVTPRLTFLPVIVIALGVGVQSAAAVVFLGAVFPIVLTTMTGIKVLEPSWTRAAQSFGANERTIFRKVMLPGSIPYVLSGMRLGFGRALLGVIVAEMYVSVGGIGNLLIRAGQAFRIGRLFVIVLMVALFGMISTLLLRAIEEKLLVWRVGMREGATGGAE